MRRYKKREITDQMLYDVLIDHKNRSFKQISEILEEIEFRKLSVDESLRDKISKNIKNCPSCLQEMKDLNSTEKSLRKIKYDFFICTNCYADIKRIDKKINIKRFEGHELHDLLNRYKNILEMIKDADLGKPYIE
jgi:hypothetical protein